MKPEKFRSKLYITASVLSAILHFSAASAAPAVTDTAALQAAAATPAQTEVTAPRPDHIATDATASAPDTLETTSEQTGEPPDHSAEFKPVQNEFLKEGEGLPGSEIPYEGEIKWTREMRKKDKILAKEIRILKRQRQALSEQRSKARKAQNKAFEEAFKNRQEYSIVFNPSDYTSKTMNANGESVSFRAYEHLVYAEHPYSAENQMLSVYIPEAYFHGEIVNGFTAETAPIFMPNGVGGYMPGEIVEPSETSRHQGANAALYALSNGYVVVSPAVRGRTLQAKNGYYIGKAPALITDYKAAVRFVRKNRRSGLLPAGDTEKIIVSGTGAGGALAALLGAAGNAADYETPLKAMGAARERDDVFAVMAYCPITNLEHADMAYEWMFRSEEGAGLTEAQANASAQLKNNFPDYLNSLNLRDSLGGRLNLSPGGDGIFREYIESLYLSSAQEALDTGEDLSRIDWLTLSEGQAVHMDFAKYRRSLKHLKGIPAFDAFDLSSAENHEFGSAETDRRHFTLFSLGNSGSVALPDPEEEKAKQEKKAALYRSATPIEKLYLEKADLLEQIEKDKQDFSPYMAEEREIRMLNPMSYINRKGVATAPYWRIRHGALDSDTALAIPAILAAKLRNAGKNVDFKVAWGYGHDGDYDLPDLFAWTDRIAKLKDTTEAILKEKKK